MYLFKGLTKEENDVHLNCSFFIFRPMLSRVVVVLGNVVPEVIFPSVDDANISCNLILYCCCSSLQIAQVHRATLSDGREVVVKVQHEGIKTIILEVFPSAIS